MKNQFKFSLEVKDSSRNRRIFTNLLIVKISMQLILLAIILACTHWTGKTIFWALLVVVLATLHQYVFLPYWRRRRAGRSAQENK